MKNSQKVSKHPEGAFRARKRLQKFGYKAGPHGSADILRKSNFRRKMRFLKQSHSAEKRKREDLEFFYHPVGCRKSE